MCRDKLVLSKPSAAPWYLPFLHPLLSLSVMFWCCIAVLVLYGKETVETIILLPAVAISLLWDFNPRRVFPVVKAGHFCSSPWANGWRVNIKGWWRWKLGDMISERHQLSRFVQIKVIKVIIPSLDSITPRFVPKREQKRWCMSICWDAAVRSGAGGKGECELWGQHRGQCYDVLFAAKSELQLWLQVFFSKLLNEHKAPYKTSRIAYSKQGV